MCCECFLNDPGSNCERSVFLATEKVADSLAVLGKSALEQTDKRLPGIVSTTLYWCRHVVEFGAPFANMATGRQAGDLE